MTRPLHLDWVEICRGPDHWLGEATVTDDLAVLDGHFPGEPIVPGVAQLFWAATLAGRIFPQSILTSEMRNLKFMKTIVPGVRLRLSLNRNARRRIAFEYSSDAGLHSRGMFLWRQ